MFNWDYLFCHVDDFTQQFEPGWQQKLLSHGAVLWVESGPKVFVWVKSWLSWLLFTKIKARNFKHFYLNHVQQYWLSAFPKLPSYQRFVQWIPSTIISLCVYLKHCFGNCTGISFIDSTKIKVCHNRRVSRHRSPDNFCVNILCGLIAYSHQPKKPSLCLEWFLPQFD